MKNSLTSMVLIVIIIILSLMTACAPEVLTGNSISGHVYDKQDGKPVKNALVEVEQTGTQPAPGITVKPGEPTPILPLANPHRAKTRTSSGGSYVIKDLPAGKYRVRATADGCNISRETVDVTDNSCTSGIDFTLSKYSSISGLVRRADDGKVISGATVLVYGPHGSTGPIQATTSTEGRYTVTGLSAGESRVGVAAGGYVPILYDGAKGTYDGYKALKVVTTYGKDTRDIDFYLEWGGSITGQIYLPDGFTPANEASIGYMQISGEKTIRFGGCLPMQQRDYVSSDSGGRYTVRGLLTGDYDLLVRYREGEAVLCSCSIVSVFKGQETNDINFILEPAGSISGYVYRSDGITPASEVKINAHNIKEFFDYGTQTASDGSYSLENLLPGDYQILEEIITLFSGENIVHDIVLPEWLDN